MVGPPPVASSTAFALHEDEFARAHVDHQHARDRVAVARLDELHGAVLLEPLDARRPHLLGEAVDDLDAGEVALVHGAVEGLAGEGLLVQRAVGIAVEEAAELVLQLADALDRLRDERPREVLVGQPLAALDRVHEVALDGVAGRERHVVAALHHARAAALAEQALHRDGDRRARAPALVRMQRGEQARPARAEDEDVGVEALHAGTARAAAQQLDDQHQRHEPEADDVEQRLRIDEQDAGDEQHARSSGVGLLEQPALEGRRASAAMPTAAVKVTSAIEPQSASASVLNEPVSSSPVPLGSSTNMNGTRNAGVVYFQPAASSCTDRRR